MLAFLAAMLALAAAPSSMRSTNVPNVPRPAEVDGLRVSLVHTADRTAFLRAWLVGARELPITNRAVRGSPLASIVIFEGCRAAADGKCNLTGHFTYLKPDGSVAGEVDGELWSEAPMRDGSALPSPGGPEIIIDPPDPMGTWTVRLRVTDNVRGVSVETEARIIVDTPPSPAAPAS
jgi:hypothetical protein